MDSHCSNSSTSNMTTTSSLTCSGNSSKSLVRINSRSTIVRNKGIKASSRNAKHHRSKGVGSSSCSRWQAAVRRDSSLTTLQMGRKTSLDAVKSNTSLASNLGRGFKDMRLQGSLGNIRNAIFNKNAPPINEKCCNSSNDNHSPTCIIKSAALQQALHREIEFQIGNNSNNAADPPLFQPLTPGQDRWSEQSRDNNRLTPGQDRGSKKKSSETRRDAVLCKPPTRKESHDNIYAS